RPGPDDLSARHRARLVPVPAVAHVLPVDHRNLALVPIRVANTIAADFRTFGYVVGVLRVAERAVLGAVEDVELVELEPDVDVVDLSGQFLAVLAAESQIPRPDLERNAAEVVPRLRERGQRVVVDADHIGETLIGDRLEVEV